ncbi:hypothetical protein MMC22_011415 [Lobaria immixta]|nr:hypothetical protein [Lobaria immixta]
MASIYDPKLGLNASSRLAAHVDEARLTNSRGEGQGKGKSKSKSKNLLVMNTLQYGTLVGIFSLKPQVWNLNAVSLPNADKTTGPGPPGFGHDQIRSYKKPKREKRFGK